MGSRAGAADVTVYEFKSPFAAPLPFVFRWCIDYSPEDPKLAKDDYVRKILSRSARRVVYEDLYDRPTGWQWSRNAVTIQPPHRWHAEMTGNLRNWTIDYELTETAPGATELQFRGVRVRTPIGPPNPPKAQLEKELIEEWRNFATALERDFRRQRRSR
jgi:hypothetical protein